MGDGIADDTKALQTWLSLGGDLYLPPGTYAINATLVQQTKSWVELASGATIKPMPSMPAGLALWRTNDSSDFKSDAVVVDGSLRGGTFDCASRLAGGIDLTLFKRFTLADVRVLNPMSFGVRLGSVSSGLHSSYEGFLHDVHIKRTSGDIPTGSIGLLLEKATDCEIRDMIVEGVDIGVNCAHGSTGNNFANIHVWGEGSPSVCFLDDAGSNSYTACTADTPSVYGFWLKQAVVRLVNCRVFNGRRPTSTAGIGVWLAMAGTQTVTNIDIIGCSFEGSSPTNRLKQDIGGTAFVDTDGQTQLTGDQIRTALLGGNYQYSTFAGNFTNQVQNAVLGSGFILTDFHFARMLTAKRILLNRDHNNDSDAPLMVQKSDGTLYARVRTDVPSVELANAMRLRMWANNFGTETVRLTGASGAITPGTSAGLGASLYSGNGAPTISGVKGDLYVNKSGSTGAWIYRCRADGANWDAVL